MKKKLIRIKALALGLIGIFLILIIIREVNTIRTKAHWESVREECEQKGLSFNFSDDFPEPVPKDKNFAYVEPLRALMEYDSDGVTPLDPEKYEKSSNFLNVPNGKKWTSSFGAKGKEIYHGYDLVSVQKFFRENGMGLWNQPEDPGEPAADVLMAIGKVSGDMDLLVESSKKRPFYRMDSRYGVKNFNVIEDFEAVMGVRSNQIQHANAQWWFNLRSLAHLETGNAESALSDLKMSIFLAELNKKEPDLVSQLYRLTLMRSALVPLWGGIAKRIWDRDQLRSLQDILGRINYLEGIQMAIRFERQLLNEIHHYLRGLLDQGADDFRASLASFGVPLALVSTGEFRLSLLKWFYISPSAFINGSQARSNDLYLKYFEGIVDLKSRRIIPDEVRKFGQYFEEKDFDKVHPYNLLIGLFFSNPLPLVKKIGEMQNLVNQARIACALEVHYLKEGKYPDTLAELGQDLPRDVFTGEMYHYLAEGEGRYRIYGGDWDLNGDGGKVSNKLLQKNNDNYPESLDVIWQNYPSPVPD